MTAPPLRLCMDCRHCAADPWQHTVVCTRPADPPRQISPVDGSTLWPTCESERASLDPESGKCTRDAIYFQAREGAG